MSMEYVYGLCRNVNCPNQPPCQRYVKKRKAFDETAPMKSSLEESWTDLSCEVCGCFDHDHDLIRRIFNGCT